MSHLSIIEDCDRNYQQIDDEEFERIETEYLKYQIGDENVSIADMNKSKLFNDHIITYFYILIFRNQGEKTSLNHAISFLITDDNRFIEINHSNRGENPIKILEKTVKAVDPILINNKKVHYLINTYQYQETQWNGGIIYKGVPEQQVSLRDVYKRVVIHTADFDMGRKLIEGDYFFSKKRSQNTIFPGSCTGITETIFHMLSPDIYENDYMSDLYRYNKHTDYENMFYNSDRPTIKKSTKKKSSRPTKKKSKRFSFTMVTSRRRKSSKKTSRRKSTRVTSRRRKSSKKTSRRKSSKKTSRRRKSMKKTSRRRKSKKKTSRRRKSIN
jgi:hypothetical protein